MKRCPECKKDYFDDSLVYCLDDGVALVQGSVTDEPATAILSGDRASGDERMTRMLGAVGSYHEFFVSPDGQRFLIGTLICDINAPPPTVILNWPALVKR